MRMLQLNDICGLLKVRGRGEDGNSCYDYNVSGKVSIKSLYERNDIKEKEIKEFLKSFIHVLEETERHLLDINRILLDPEYIYYEDGSYYFCYYPPGKRNLWEEFHTLTEFFVKHADYNDPECVRIMFLLHKETMEENYSLKSVVERCLEQVREEPPVKRKEKELVEEIRKEEYDRTQHDWIAKQDTGNLIMEETERMWKPVKRFLQRHKKPKWGDWDGLYIEEEEL